MSNAFLRKLLIGLWGAALFVLPFEFAAFGAQVEETAADDVAKQQAEISADIAKTRAVVEAELEGMRLGSADVAQRLEELAALNETASDDMAAWGYTEAQRERHLKVLSELTIAYAAYSTIPSQGYSNGEQQPQPAAAPVSADINASDALRREINKVSRGLELQAFILDSKLDKLWLDLSRAEQLRKELQADQKGEAILEMPRTHALELELARLNIALSSVQVRMIRQSFDHFVDIIARLKLRLAAMKEELTFTEETLNANLKRLQERIDALSEEMEAARKSLESATSSAVRARAALAGKEAADDVLNPATSHYTARAARVNYWESMISLLDDEIQLLREAQDIWRERYRLFRDEASGEEIWKDMDYAQRRIDELQRILAGAQTVEENFLHQIETIQEQADAVAKGSDTDGKTLALSPEDRIKTQQNLLQAIDNQRKIITDVLNRYESQCPNAIFLYQRLYNEASDRISAIRIAEKVHSFSKETIMAFLDTELWRGEGYSVTVWRLCIAVLVFLSSFFLSAMGSRWLKARMIKRFNASETAANATQRIIFYILWIAFALTALNIVKIPLTAFAFLGGAFAVGFGFGMQNIFNNLISGFIIIFSRPFKVRDIISVAGTEGVVRDIGSRSTTIGTWDGLDVVMPNRYFLENNVTNWTGSDQKKRDILTVGVSYNADTRKVEELMLEVMKGHSRVLKDPAPFVIFRDFGDSALAFEGYYWVDLRQANRLKVASDMRHHLISLFREEGIEIPYPQQDVHIIPQETGVKEASPHEAGGN